VKGSDGLNLRLHSAHAYNRLVKIWRWQGAGPRQWLR